MKVVFVYILLTASLLAQSFKVEKVTGEVLLLRGTSENFVSVKAGDELSGKDMILTGGNSVIILKKGKDQFILKDNSALNLSSIKKLTINQLLLALAMEEIRSVPKKNNSEMKSTAVYGSGKNGKALNPAGMTGLGMKKLNGARQLAESGFNESAVLAAREVFRKHPETRKAADERIYFAGIFEKLKLTDEAFEEYSAIYDLQLSPVQKKYVSDKIQALIKK